MGKVLWDMLWREGFYSRERIDGGVGGEGIPPRPHQVPVFTMLLLNAWYARKAIIGRVAEPRSASLSHIICHLEARWTSSAFLSP
jgi:hypothetical protein